MARAVSHFEAAIGGLGSSTKANGRLRPGFTSHDETAADSGSNLSAPPPEAAAEAKRKKRRGGKSRNEPKFDLAGKSKRVAGVDLTRIDGIKVGTLQTVFSEAFRLAASTLRESNSYRAPSSGDCGPAWGPQKPSLPWPASWRGWSTGCSALDTNT